MRVFFYPGDFPRFRRAVVAMGVFDGMHLGHRRVVRAAVRTAGRIAGASVVVTFHPHPRGKESLYSLEHRLRLIEELGVHACIILRFNRRLARIAPERFIRDILVRRCAPYAVYVGENFRFGRNASGDSRLLKRLGDAYGFRVRRSGVVRVDGRPVSSTHIRHLISTGKLRSASRLLARPVSVFGTVISGTRWGRRLGFPTANVDPHHEIMPPEGVYAVRAQASGAHKISGVCYIGRRPRFVQLPRRGRTIAKTVEVHLFDFKKDIYGRHLEVEFIKKLRSPRTFHSAQPLIAQIKRDIHAAKAALSTP